MNKVYFEFYDSQNIILDNIVVELLDTAGAKAWQYAVLINNGPRKIIAKKIAINGTHNQYLKEQYQHLVKLVVKLNSTGYAFVENMPASAADVDQYLLNRLHRHFTNTCEIIWSPEFRNFELTMQLNTVLQDINLMIHRIENFYPTPQKKLWSQQAMEIWAVPGNDQLSFDIKSYRGCHTFQHADLILDPHILGKTLLESYLCDDDPSARDTGGHLLTSGGACFVLDDGRQKIYNSQDFNDWLKKYGCNKHQAFADFPIGNFAPGMKERLVNLVAKYKPSDYTCRANLAN